ncbi:MAG: putative hydrolase YxeP [Alphaproteobacteria bacterium MarineAlpha4_Bin2]|nr:MAG: putative hydrolase YxeP [Alphaproteobacteria bacterium MarineAlpha4_Bin2]
MPIKDEIAAFVEEMRAWRRDIHAHPETAFEETRTSNIVADKLQSFGIEVHRGLATTGVVGTLAVGNSNRAIGLRADLDALDILEENTFDHVSTNPGKMHACGHDGHTAMLLGAAKYLSETRRFNGTVQFIFQPAEENEAGGRVMCEDGLFELFPVEAVYGMHNQPGLPLGKFGMRVGPSMASADMFEIMVTGKGSHAAHPHHGADPIVTGSEIVTALQRIASRVTNPIDAAVVSVTQFHSGTNMNVIPEIAVIKGTCRTLSRTVQDTVEVRLKEVARGIAAAHGLTAEIVYDRRYPVLVNTAEETIKAAKAAIAVAGEENVNTDHPPTMGSEDFAWMLQERPGCYIRVGNGEGEDGGCVVHNPHYDFNDQAAVYGASYWATLVEQELSPA